jgi:hypothetical protein
MSSAKVIAQAVPAGLKSWPLFRLPCRMRMIADISGGAPVIRATSTPGVAVANPGGGVYNITFDAGRDLSDINIQCYANTPGTNTLRSSAVPDASSTNTNATTGKLSVITAPESSGTPANLQNGDILEVNWTMDYG